MPRMARQMTLTRALAARAARAVQDEGPAPGSLQLADEDYELAVREILAQAPSEGHRAFCIRVLRFGGTVERPGLMISLDRGGQCRGMVFRLCGDVRGSLHKLLRRELVIKPPPQHVRWLVAQSTGGPVRGRGCRDSRRKRLGVLRPVSPRDGRPPRGARHPRPQPVATAAARRRATTGR